MRRRSLALLAALAGVMAMAPPAQAAITTPVAVWQMNEPASASTMTDSSGNQITGTIGSRVAVGTRLSGGGSGYRFPYRQPNKPPADPQHLVVVAHHGRLNPGTGAFAVQVRLRTTQSFGNLIQKGQSASPGGYWKFEQPNGKIACLFRGSKGTSTATSGTRRVNDGRWHTVRCERTPASVVMKVDGQVTGRNTNATGSVANTKALTIAGKLGCDQVKATCDYFVGEIDYVKIQRS
jgi:Laminin G domain